MENTGLQLLKNESNNITQLILVHMPIGTSIDEADRVRAKEFSNLEMLVQMKPELLGCTPSSMVYALKACIADNLSISPSAGLAYMVPGQVNDAAGNKQWVVTYKPTVNGLLSIAFQKGSILDVKSPTVIYDENGKVTKVLVHFLVPSWPNPRWDSPDIYNHVFFERIKRASEKKNNGKANANYTSWNGGIDPVFASTKAMKHYLEKRGTNNNYNRPASAFSTGKFSNIIPAEVAYAEVNEEHGLAHTNTATNADSTTSTDAHNAVYVKIHEAVTITETNAQDL